MKKTGRSRPSTTSYITARRLDAAEFMRAAPQLDNDGYHPDVVVTLAAHAAPRRRGWWPSTGGALHCLLCGLDQ